MRIPVWVTLGIALFAFLWGAYRIRLAFGAAAKNAAPEAPRALGTRRPLLSLSLARHTHFLFGLVYLILSAFLVATTFGWNPIGDLIGPRTETPDKAAAPSKPGSVPIDQLPPPSPAKPAGPAHEAPPSSK